MSTLRDTSTLVSDAVDALAPELFAFIQQLVRTPSLPGEEHAVQQVVADHLRRLGLEVDVVPCRFDELRHHAAFCDDGLTPDGRVTVVGRWSAASEAAENGARSLILNGHVDVVSPGDEALWSESPWSGAIRDGRMYGRGCCDMKAGLASGIFAVAALKAIGFRPAGDVIIESVSGEETGGIGTLAAIVKGYRADAAIILEPTALKMSPVQAGAVTFRLTISGRASHACMKSSGVSAIHKASYLLAAIDDHDRARHQAFSSAIYADPDNVAPISVGTLHAGDWHSTVPNRAVLEGRCGVLPGESVDEAKDALAGALANASAADSWLAAHPPTLEWFEATFEAGQTDLDSPILNVLGASHRSVLRRDAVLEGVTYGSDLRLFTNHASIPAVLYGPGDVVNAHTVDEFIDLAEIRAATKVLALTIERWCGRSE